MNSLVHESEEALARIACQEITNQPRARVLIGGLGMGYTVGSALNYLEATAQVVVAELVSEVVQWNRGVLAKLAGCPLDDSRVTIHEADVVQMINSAQGDYNAILLDVDNGPEPLTRNDNDGLYSLEGLRAAFAALRPKGVLAIWSTGPDPNFAQRLRRAGFKANKVEVRGRERGKGSHFIVWAATRT